MDEKEPETSDIRYVAFFDVLGMSDLILQNHAKAWKVLYRLRRAMEAGLQKVAFGVAIEGATPTPEREMRAAKYIRYFTFSDSILMYTHGETPADLLSIVSFCSQFFAHAFDLCVPLRGAIAHGEFWFNREDNLFSGPALVTAYRSAEEPQWLGVTVDDNVSTNVAPFLSPPDMKPPICDRDLKVKSETHLKRFKVLDWVTPIKGSFRVDKPLDGKKLYDAGFQKVFGAFEHLDARSREKYAATAAFIDSKLC